jgi:hypothetical protein
MSVSIRKEYSVTENETERVQELKRLASLGVLELEKEKIQYCKCGESHKVEGVFLLESRLTCSCERTVNLSEKSTLNEYVIKEINYKKIVKMCNQQLIDAIGKSNCHTDKRQNVWICDCFGKKVPVFILEASSYNQFIDEDSDWLCIVIDWGNEKYRINDYNALHFLKIEDLLFNKINLAKCLEAITCKFSTNTSVELIAAFKKYVSEISWMQFEEFAANFLNAIKEKQAETERFFNYLTTKRNTIFNSKIVSLGGPANPDFIVINLLEYLQQALRPNKSGEVKHYVDSELKIEKYSPILLHARKSDTLCIVASNKIDPELWKHVIDSYKEEGYYKHVFLDADTIVLLIKSLDLRQLIATKGKDD